MLVEALQLFDMFGWQIEGPAPPLRPTGRPAGVVRAGHTFPPPHTGGGGGVTVTPDSRLLVE
jgi:hypothetical protein